ncbi:MAG: hypothetical protein ACLFV3_09125 [Phycisphaeraceae bacterium]
MGRHLANVNLTQHAIASGQMVAYDGRRYTPHAATVQGLSARDPLHDIVPSPAAPVMTASASSIRAQWLDRDTGSTLYGSDGGELYESTDDGETWSLLHDFGRGITMVRVLGDGELLVGLYASVGTVAGTVYKSSGYPASGSGASWDLVLTLGDGATDNIVVPGEWGASVEGEVAVLNEYGDKGAATRVYLSRDYGDTWDIIFDLADVATDLSTAHTHGSCYDPYWNRIWIVTGDSENRSIRYSDDWGENWTIVTRGIDDAETYQPVGIIALPRCLLLTSDAPPNGVQRIWRRDRDDPRVETAWLADTAHALTIVGKASYWRGPGHPVFLCFTRHPDHGPGRILGTWDGETIHELWRDPVNTDTSNGAYYAMGPTASGRVACWLKVGDGQQFGTFEAPAWIPDEPPTLRSEAWSRYLPSLAGGDGPVTHGAADLATPDGLDVRCLIAADDWASGLTQTLVAKEAGSDEAGRSWYFSLRPDGKLWMRWFPDGVQDGNISVISSSAPSGVVDGEARYLRVVMDPDTGSGDYEVRFYESDDGDNWDQVGTTQTGTGGALTPTDAEYSVGQRGLPAGGDLLTGRLYWAQVRHGEDGEVVVEPDFRSPHWPVARGSYSSASLRRPGNAGETWQLEGDAAVVAELDLSQVTGHQARTVTGSTGDNTALESLLAALDAAGVITDSTS